MLHTTLKLCKEHEACAEGFKKLKKSLGKGHSKTDLIPLTHIIESNGLQDALWALRATVEDSDYLAREFAIFCARQVLPLYEDKYPNDSKVRDCIDATERYNNKEITLDELEVFRDAAWTAARDYESAAWAAARAAESAVTYLVTPHGAADHASYWAWEAAEADAYIVRDAQTLKLAELLNNHKEK
jgi:hypothetical protein